MAVGTLMCAFKCKCCGFVNASDDHDISRALGGALALDLVAIVTLLAIGILATTGRGVAGGMSEAAAFGFVGVGSAIILIDYNMLKYLLCNPSS